MKQEYLLRNFVDKSGKPKQKVQTYHLLKADHSDPNDHIHLTPLEHVTVVLENLPFGPSNTK